MPYRIEYAKSQRSSCKGGKSCTDKSINKGELRLGSEAEVGSHTSVYWRHWRCVTGKQLQNLQEAHGDDVESIEGFSSLSAEDKDKVRLAVSSGVNADFVEVEKPPKTKKAPAAKKAKKDAVDVDADAGVDAGVEGEEDGGATAEDEEAEKPAPKKRGRPPKKAADVEEGGDDEVKPPPKKRGRPPKKAVEAEEGAESADAPEPKKRGRKPKAATAATEDGNGNAAAAAEAPAPKKRGRPPKKVEAAVESD